MSDDRPVPVTLINAFARLLEGGAPLPDEPADLDQALRIHLAVAEQLESDGDPIVGWKVAFTVGPLRSEFPDDFRPFGSVVASRLFQTGDTIEVSGIRRPRIEPEICLIVDRDYDPGSDEPVATYVRGIAPAFEIHEARVPDDAPLLTKVADNAACWGVVVGNMIEVPDGDLRQSMMTVWRDGEQIAHGSRGSEIDDPISSLWRLRNALAPHGRHPRADDVVITGGFSYDDVGGPSTWSAEFDGLGRVEINFV